jgi:hypothetical protein
MSFFCFAQGIKVSASLNPGWGSTLLKPCQVSPKERNKITHSHFIWKAKESSI